MDFLITLLVLIGIVDAALLGILLLGAVVALNRLGQTIPVSASSR